MCKRQTTKNIFDMLAEHDDGEPDTVQPTPQPEAADSARESKAPAAETRSDEETATDTTEDDQTAGVPTRGPLRRRVVAVLAGVVVAVILGLSGLLGWRLKQLDDTAAAGKAALEAARNYAVILTTLDAKDLDGNYRQALDGATGEFKAEIRQGSSAAPQIPNDKKAGGKGLVRDAAVKTAAKTKVGVLLFVAQTATNPANQ